MARLSAPVIEVRIYKSERAAHDIEAACNGAATGSFVRLHVGRLRPPPWIAAQLPDDLVFQVCAATASAASAWNSALGGEE